MLYLGIDQHKSPLTVNLRSEDGLVIAEPRAMLWSSLGSLLFNALAANANE
jgi:hypothetical protein